MSRLLALSLALLIAGAGAQTIALDPSLLTSLSEVPEKVSRQVQRRDPVVAHFKKGVLDLYYVAANHEIRPQNETCAVIARVFRRFAIGAVIIEGHPYDWGASWSSRRVPEIRRERQAGSGGWDEGDCATLSGSDARAPVYGGEPTNQQELRDLQAHGYALEDFLAFDFLRMAGYYSRTGQWSPSSAGKVFSGTLAWDRQQLGLGGEETFDYPRFLAWYREKNGEKFELIDKEKLEAAPDAKGALFAQRIGAEVDRTRNRFLARTISRCLNEYRRVLVVYGNGHLAAQWRALTAALGEPVYVGDLRAEGKPS